MMAQVKVRGLDNIIININMRYQAARHWHGRRAFHNMASSVIFILKFILNTRQPATGMVAVPLRTWPSNPYSSNRSGRAVCLRRLA